MKKVRFVGMDVHADTIAVAVADRTYHMHRWADAFGSRPRTATTATDIRRQLERWRRHGRQDGGPLNPSSLNRRRTALMHFFTVMDGRSAANPVKDVPPYPEHASEQLRAQPWRVCHTSDPTMPGTASGPRSRS